ncbi:MAG: HEAT repeat domain-containing protein [Lentisphaerota bacterium]
MTTLKKMDSWFLWIIFSISISALGQGTGVITTASKNRELTATRISVLIQKKNWEKVRDYGDAAVVPLIKALKDNDKEIRIGAAEALGPLGDLRAVEPLSECLKDNSNKESEFLRTNSL